jgi:hypothetical protein
MMIAMIPMIASIHKINALPPLDSVIQVCPKITARNEESDVGLPGWQGPGGFRRA